MNIWNVLGLTKFRISHALFFSQLYFRLWLAYFLLSELMETIYEFYGMLNEVFNSLNRHFVVVNNYLAKYMPLLSLNSSIKGYLLHLTLTSKRCLVDVSSTMFLNPQYLCWRSTDLGCPLKWEKHVLVNIGLCQWTAHIITRKWKVIGKVTLDDDNYMDSSDNILNVF